LWSVFLALQFKKDNTEKSLLSTAGKEIIDSEIRKLASQFNKCIKSVQTNSRKNAAAKNKGPREKIR